MAVNPETQPQPSVRKALALTFIGNYGGIAIQLGALVILSRLMTPAEVGVFSIAAALIGIAGMVRDFGIGEYVIVAERLTRERLRAAFTLNVLVSWTMALAIWLCRHAIGRFYDNPAVAEVLGVMAANFVLIPFGALTMAYLRRELRMGPILVATLASAIVSNGVSIALVASGWSYLGLAWGSFAGIVTSVAIARWYRPDWFPRGPGMAGLREAARYGVNLSTVYIVGQVGKSAPDLILGRAQGEEAVGLFARASGLVDVFSRTVIATVSRVALPYYAAQNRTSDDANADFCRTIAYVTGIGWLYCAALAVGAHVLMEFLFGKNWTGAAPIVTLLAGAYAIDMVFCLAKEYLIARNALAQSARLQLANQAIQILACFACAPFGIVALAYGLIASAFVNALVTYLFLHRACALEARAVLSAIRRSALCGLVAYPLWSLAAYLIDATIQPILPRALAFGAVVAVTSLAVVFIFRHPIQDELLKMAAFARAGRHAASSNPKHDSRPPRP